MAKKRDGSGGGTGANNTDAVIKLSLIMPNTPKAIRMGLWRMAVDITDGDNDPWETLEAIVKHITG